MEADWIDLPSLKRRHRYFLRSGFYIFLAKNILKVTSILLALILLFVVLERWVIDMDVVFKSFFKNTPFHLVFVIFTISESFFGLIPPDFFIIWAKNFDHVWLIISTLACLSYIGGLISYYIGSRIRRIKNLNNYLSKKFNDNLKKIKRWGGVFLVVAAMFPLPYSTICIISGILKYPLNSFMWLGLVRILRFYIYALVLFGLIRF